MIAPGPHEGLTAALYLFGAEIMGLLWYLLYLRRKIANWSADGLRQEVVELEESGPASFLSIRLSDLSASDTDCVESLCLLRFGALDQPSQMRRPREGS